MNQECILWERAKSLGKERGLDVEGEMRNCATINLCQEGDFCIYLSHPDNGPEQIEKFQTRQEKTDALQLAEVRRFLATQIK